jgi:hypothetical protein
MHRREFFHYAALTAFVLAIHAGPHRDGCMPGLA